MGRNEDSSLKRASVQDIKIQIPYLPGRFQSSSIFFCSYSKASLESCRRKPVMVGMHGSQERRAAPWHPAAAAMPVFFFHAHIP